MNWTAAENVVFPTPPPTNFSAASYNCCKYASMHDCCVGLFLIAGVWYELGLEAQAQEGVGVPDLEVTNKGVYKMDTPTASQIPRVSTASLSTVRLGGALLNIAVQFSVH